MRQKSSEPLKDLIRRRNELYGLSLPVSEFRDENIKTLREDDERKRVDKERG